MCDAATIIDKDTKLFYFSNKHMLSASRFIFAFLLLGQCLGGRHFTRCQGKKPTATFQGDTLSNYLLNELTNVASENHCASSCTSRNGCNCAYYQMSTKSCSLYWASVANGILSATEQGAGPADVIFDAVLDASALRSSKTNVFVKQIFDKIMKPCTNPQPMGTRTWSGSTNITEEFAFSIRPDQIVSGANIQNQNNVRTEFGRLFMYSDQFSGTTTKYYAGWGFSYPASFVQINFDAFTWIHYFDVITLGFTYSNTLRYSLDGNLWLDYVKYDGSVVFWYQSGRTVGEKVVYRQHLWQPILAKHVRFQPRTVINSNWGIQIEFYGCLAIGREPLGIEADEFAPSQYSSSTDDGTNRKAHHSNLNHWLHGWLAANNVPSTGEWIQLDMLRNMIVTGLATQLQRPDAVVVRGTTKFSLQYCQSQNCPTLQNYPKDFDSTSSGNTFRVNMFDEPIIARIVRLTTITFLTTAGIRWELYGCRNIPIATKSETLNRPVIAATSTISLPQRLPILSQKLTDEPNRDEQGRLRSCLAIDRDPSNPSYVTIDLDASSKQISEIVVTPPRLYSGLDPVGLWLFDAVTMASDQSGYGNDGVVSPAVQLSTGPFGKPKTAFFFPGNVQGAAVVMPRPYPSSPLVNPPSSDFSLFMWLKIDTNVWPDTLTHIFQFTTWSAGNGFFILAAMSFPLNTSTFYLKIYNSADAASYVPLEVYRWHFIGVMIDRIKNMIYFYANGAIVGAALFTVDISSTILSDSPISFGPYTAWEAKTASKHIACVQFYHRLLTRHEIDDAMLCPWQTPIPKMLWPFNADYGSNDYLGGSINGTAGSSVAVTTFQSGPINAVYPDGAYQFTNSSNSFVAFANTGGQLNSPYALTVSFYTMCQTPATTQSVLGWIHPTAVPPAYSVGVTCRQGYFNFTVTCHNMAYAAQFRANLTIRASAGSRMRHIAMTYHYSTGKFKVYHEGDLAVMRQLPVGCELETSGQFRVGAPPSPSNLTLTEPVACVQMFDQALTVREIQQVSRCPLNGFKAAMVWTVDSYFRFANFFTDPVSTVVTDVANSRTLTSASLTWAQGLAPTQSTHRFSQTTSAISGAVVAASKQALRSGAFTVMIWLSLEVVPTATRHIVSTQTAIGVSHIAFKLSPTPLISVHFTCTGGTTYSIEWPNAIDTNKWNHFAMSYDNSTAKMALFVNGIEYTAGTLSSATCSNVPVTTHFRLGGSAYDSSGSPVMSVACLQTFDRALTQYQLAHVMNGCPSKIEYAPSQCEYYISQQADSRMATMSVSHCSQLPTVDHPDCFWRHPTTTNPWMDWHFNHDFELRAFLSAGNPNADEWVTSFRLKIKGGINPGSLIAEHLIMEPNGTTRIFQGNFDRNTVVENRLPYPVRGRGFYLDVISFYNWPSMRFGWKGCKVRTCSQRLDYIETAVSASGFNGPTINHFGYDLETGHLWLLTLGSPVETNDDIWWQIAFGLLAKVTELQIRGSASKFGNALGWIQKFWLGYSFDGIQFLKFKKEDGHLQEFIGNSDASSFVDVTLRNPLVGRFMRLYPSQIYNNTIAMGLRIYGCPVEDMDEVVMPQIVVTLGNNSVSNASTALTNPQVAFTVMPGEMHDRKPIRLPLKPGSLAGRYLTVMTTFRNVIGLEICDVAAYNHASSNVALQKRVELSPNSYSVAESTKHKATDGTYAIDESGSTGQVCTVGSNTQPPVEQPSNDVHDVTPAGAAGSLPVSQCIGSVVHWEMSLRVLLLFRRQNATLDGPSASCYLQNYQNVSATQLKLKGVVKFDVSAMSDSTRMFFWEPSSNNFMNISPGDVLGAYHGASTAIFCGFGMISSSFGWNPLVNTAGPLPWNLPWGSAMETSSGATVVSGTNMTRSQNFFQHLIRGFVINPSIEAWIAVDLRLKSVIARVLVYIAANRYGYSLIDTELRVGDSLDNLLGNTQICDFVSAIMEFDYRYASRPYELYCLPPLAARYVVLRRTNPGLLPITEILVYSS